MAPKLQPNMTMRVFLMKYRPIRKLVYAFNYLVPATYHAFFTKNGVYSKEGRILVWGKFRRMFQSFFPGYAESLQKRYGIEGGCRSCGASCKLLFQCPHWDEPTHLCTIYEDRPNTCRSFPITPADIRDRNLVLKDEPCGFVFTKSRNTPSLIEPLKDGIKPMIKKIKSKKRPKN